MSAYDFGGLLAGVAGLALLLVGILLALSASLRLLFVIRRPGKGRIARALAAAGLVLVLCGVAIFAAAELSPFRRTVDRGAVPLSAVSLLLAVLAAMRAGRRRRPARTAEAAPAPADGKPAHPTQAAKG